MGRAEETTKKLIEQESTKQLTEELKQQIDAKSYTELLKDWRDIEGGHPDYCGEVGVYRNDRLELLRPKVSEKELVVISNGPYAGIDEIVETTIKAGGFQKIRNDHYESINRYHRNYKAICPGCGELKILIPSRLFNGNGITACESCTDAKNSAGILVDKNKL